MEWTNQTDHSLLLFRVAGVTCSVSALEVGSIIVPPKVNSRTFIHTVKRGDTLWDIAKHYINDPWRYRDLVKQNPVDNPDLIHPGEKVKIIFRERK